MSRPIEPYARAKSSWILGSYLIMQYVSIPRAPCRTESLTAVRSQRGNLQDVISRQSVTGERMEERQLLRLFRGTCEAYVSSFSDP
jgi:hypothetical protein